VRNAETADREPQAWVCCAGPAGSCVTWVQSVVSPYQQQQHHHHHHCHCPSQRPANCPSSHLPLRCLLISPAELDLAWPGADNHITQKKNRYREKTIQRHRQIHTLCLKKTVKIIFFHNFVKFPPILIIFGTKIGKTTELCKVNSFTSLPNLCQRTTVWNTDAPNCYITWWLFVSDCSHPRIINLTVDARCHVV